MLGLCRYLGCTDMMTILGVIGRRAPLVLVLGVVAGILLPGMGNLLGPVFQVLVVMLLVTAMMRVDVPQVLSHIRRPLRMIIILVFLMVAMPFAIYILAGYLGLSPTLHMALVLLTMAPPLSAAAGMATLMKLDDALTLNIIVVGTLIAPFSAPFLAVSFFEFPFDLDVHSMLLRLVLTVGISLFIALVIRRIAGRRWIEEKAQALDGVNALVLVAFAIVVMNGIGWSNDLEPRLLMQTLAAVFLINWGLHGLTLLAAIFVPSIGRSANSLISKRAGAISLMAGNRNLALFMAALPTDVAASLMLFLALYQLPIYLTPMLTLPIYRRLLNSR